jgi:LL-diaminopimelate aminotransferase
LATGLKKFGWEVQEPKAGACLWAQYPEIIASYGEAAMSPSVRVAHELLKKTGVLVTPGIVFGEGWEGFVRFSAVVTEERMREVVAALGEMKGA